MVTAAQVQVGDPGMVSVTVAVHDGVVRLHQGCACHMRGWHKCSGTMVPKTGVPGPAAST